ncbi:uncharacterized protein HLK63_D04301 [Nakaseomyces glabratus]|nr:uncharacterized protein GW608_D04301 [Nakaseomyces glabratus]UCS24805.1 uncharacterized protein HLK63_D04301 [Nakaseomyces glabratus]UCS30035.1 uncharacterized protein HLK64_D04301 [Nakaseomyces glabratus]UCS35263.1 uncharacterized protein HLK62_D04301 [Nakaseomyces glabratus]
MSSAVIFVESATPGTLTEFKDLLAKQLLEVRETWSLEFRTYRTLVKDFPSREKLLYSLTFPHHDKKTVLIRNSLAWVLGTAEIPDNLQTCSTGLSESIDQLLASKLSNMWAQRQVIRGDAGQTLLITGDVTVRIINLFAATGFKGLLIELDNLQSATSLTNITDLLNEMKVKVFKVASAPGLKSEDVEVVDSSSTMESDNEALFTLAKQYIEVLE